ncbi:hypothetical protein TNCV_3821181 [Trichonephila clavipes]|nr:hypothetical protein TNCV_3821181 [Trichonephila clavipes]
MILRTSELHERKNRLRYLTIIPAHLEGAEKKRNCSDVSLAITFTRSSPDENVWSVVVERLTRHHTTVTTVDKLWHRVKAAWASVLIHALQPLFEYVQGRISALIIARGGCSEC